MPKIITRHLYPPIPMRQFDWCAYYEGDEENGSRYGWGLTEIAAILDLKENVEEPEPEKLLPFSGSF